MDFASARMNIQNGIGNSRKTQPLNNLFAFLNMRNSAGKPKIESENRPCNPF
jgi:hypothetical protein